MWTELFLTINQIISLLCSKFSPGFSHLEWNPHSCLWLTKHHVIWALLPFWPYYLPCPQLTLSWSHEALAPLTEDLGPWAEHWEALSINPSSMPGTMLNALQMLLHPGFTSKQKGLISQTEKRLKQPNGKKTNEPIYKMGKGLELTVHKRWHSNGQQVHEKMLSITNHHIYTKYTTWWFDI